MSTVGKVLVVLCMLVAAIWVILFSAVGELNKNWTRTVANLKADVESLKADVAKNERDIVALKDEITLEQKATAEQLAVLRSRQADAEKARTEMTEMATRVKFQLAGIEAAVKSAQAASELRLTEREAEKKALDAVEHDVEELKIEHADLVTQLDNLRSEFKDTLESNRQLVDRLAKAGNKPGP
jgi:chromosome segregation ATPase